MSATLSFVIRDGLESDVKACLELDHRYDTDYVWQMNVQQEPGQWQVIFKTERLPRSLEVSYPVDENRLRLALPPETCYLVAVRRDEDEILGYLTMRPDPAHHIGFIQDLVISRPYRRNRIGKRLLNVARQWARERQLVQLTIETQTKNYPAITFCQANSFAFCGFNDRYFLNQDIAVFFTQSLR